jgi:hypothetical protein
MQFEINGKIHCFSARVDDMPGFCGEDVLHNFEYWNADKGKLHYRYDEDDSNAIGGEENLDTYFQKAKSVKEAALRFITLKCKACNGSKLIMHDHVEGQIHKYLMKLLPKKFTYKSDGWYDSGTTWQCTVKVGKPYMNRNHNHKTIECEILIQKAKKKANVKREGRVSPA